MGQADRATYEFRYENAAAAGDCKRIACRSYQVPASALDGLRRGERIPLGSPHRLIATNTRVRDGDQLTGPRYRKLPPGRHQCRHPVPQAAPYKHPAATSPLWRTPDRCPAQVPPR
jgi:hypothetical protein